MAGDKAPPPHASPCAPCRDGRVKRPSTKIGWPSRCHRREGAVVRGPRLQKRRATVSASRVAQVVRVPRVVFSTVSGVTRAAVVGDVGVGVARLGRAGEVSSSAIGRLSLLGGGLCSLGGLCPPILPPHFWGANNVGTSRTQYQYKAPAAGSAFEDSQVAHC